MTVTERPNNQTNRDALAALLAKWEYDQSYAYNRDVDGIAGAGTPWGELDNDYRDGVIAAGYPLADAILAAGWRAPECAHQWTEVGAKHDEFLYYECLRCRVRSEWDTSRQCWTVPLGDHD